MGRSRDQGPTAGGWEGPRPGGRGGVGGPPWGPPESLVEALAHCWEVFPRVQQGRHRGHLEGRGTPTGAVDVPLGRTGSEASAAPHTATAGFPAPLRFRVSLEKSIYV